MATTDVEVCLDLEWAAGYYMILRFASSYSPTDMTMFDSLEMIADHSQFGFFADELSKQVALGIPGRCGPASLNRKVLAWTFGLRASTALFWQLGKESDVDTAQRRHPSRLISPKGSRDRVMLVTDMLWVCYTLIASECLWRSALNFCCEHKLGLQPVMAHSVSSPGVGLVRRTAREVSQSNHNS